ncbi:unnamed protein product [Urochloa humidicola]
MPSCDYPGKQLGNFRSSQAGGIYPERSCVNSDFHCCLVSQLPEQLDLSTCSLRYGSFLEPFAIHEFI